MLNDRPTLSSWTLFLGTLLSFSALAQVNSKGDKDPFGNYEPAVEKSEKALQLEAEAYEELALMINEAQLSCQEEGRRAFEQCCDQAPNRCNDDREFQTCHSRGNRVQKDCEERKMKEFLEALRKFWEQWRRFFENLFN